jgi:hypothetical protein
MSDVIDTTNLFALKNGSYISTSLSSRKPLPRLSAKMQQAFKASISLPKAVSIESSSSRSMVSKLSQDFHIRSASLLLVR